jgi:hypothetical protein
MVEYLTTIVFLFLFLFLFFFFFFFCSPWGMMVKLPPYLLPAEWWPSHAGCQVIVWTAGRVQRKGFVLSSQSRQP